jgi:hypothetical protein
VEAVIRSTAAVKGTPAALVEAILARLRPSIRLAAREGDVERVGGSRIGGLPDLPEGTPWPRLEPLDEDDLPPAYAFILQVDLAETRGLDPEGALPEAGLLSYFYLLEEDDEDDGSCGASLVLFFPPSGPLLRRLAFPDDLPKDRRFRPLQLVPQPEWTVPPPADVGLGYEEVRGHPERIKQLGLWGYVDDRLAEAQGLSPDPGQSVHRLLGHPQMIQSPGLADGTRLLLQADSDPPRRFKGSPRTGMMWGDCGMLYLLLSEEELKARRWELVWTVLEMH